MSQLLSMLWACYKAKKIHKEALCSTVRCDSWHVYHQVSWEEQPLCRRPCVEAGRRQQQVAQSLPSGAAQVVGRTWCISPRSAGGPGHAQHRPGTSRSHVLMTECVYLQCSWDCVSFQLVDMQWKLGMAVSSDTCRSLNSPYVSLLLKIIEPSGQISQRSFEMTIPQFQVCIYGH